MLIVLTFVFIGVLLGLCAFTFFRILNYIKYMLEEARERNLDAMTQAIRLYVVESVKLYAEQQNTAWVAVMDTLPAENAFVVVGLIDPNFEPPTVVRPARFNNGKFYNLEPYYIPDITIEYAELQNVVKWRYLPKFQ